MKAVSLGIFFLLLEKSKAKGYGSKTKETGIIFMGQSDNMNDFIEMHSSLLTLTGVLEPQVEGDDKKVCVDFYTRHKNVFL